MAGAIEFVLFDLGGVLVDPGGVGPMRELSRIGTDEELWARWLSCRWVRRFEAGLCSPEEFAGGVVADWELELEPAAFLDEFSGWVNAPYPGALELVAAVRDDVGVGCLSNTNAVQWHANYEATAITEAFTFRFLSFELGLVKPDRQIFEVVAARLPVPPGRVLFLDDNAANVSGAEASGFVARHVRGVEEARRALGAEGALAG
ncbi:MAG: HAD family hydrolase [Acidimicrobiales bacterium]|jgi:putative hydrolase of the HAD superfamily